MRRPRRIATAAVPWLVFVAIVLVAIAAPAARAAGPADKPRTTAPPSPVAMAPEYLVAPGDVLKVGVWKEPELTTEVAVRLDGRITVPLLGDVQAAGRTPDQLAVEIQTRMARFLEVPPQVTVTVAQAVSARFYVLGDVINSGAFPLTNRTTVLQALALAGGFKEFAKRERIIIIRERAAVRTAIPFNYAEVEAGNRLEQNIPLEAGDTILVP
jgi:polysaccharide export outer membrane protein